MPPTGHWLSKDIEEDDEWLEQLYDELEIGDIVKELDFNSDPETDYGVNRDDDVSSEEPEWADEDTTGAEDSPLDGDTENN